MSEGLPTKGSALHSWLMQAAGVQAYAEDSVPAKAGFPRLTYSATLGAYGDGRQALSCDLWAQGEAEANALAQRLSEAVTSTGAMVPCRGGAVWVLRGSPFCQATPSGSAGVKRRSVNLTVEFLTQD